MESGHETNWIRALKWTSLKKSSIELLPSTSKKELHCNSLAAIDTKDSSVRNAFRVSGTEGGGGGLETLLLARTQDPQIVSAILQGLQCHATLQQVAIAVPRRNAEQHATSLAANMIRP